jgi:hypothetical protein
LDCEKNERFKEKDVVFSTDYMDEANFLVLNIVLGQSYDPATDNRMSHKLIYLQTKGPANEHRLIGR